MEIDQLYKIYAQNYSVSTDTRQITPGCIFFALRGDNFNGNLYASKALEAGASYAVIDDPTLGVHERYILVADVLTCLQDLARYHRNQLSIPFIGITGTNGKTTTKELVNSVLSQKFRTYATKGNLNNHIGVPLTILAVNREIEIAIIEMGANHQKEIEFLCSIAQPSHGLITNIGKAHLEGFGGPEGVKKGKGELYEWLQKSSCTAFINRDNPILVDMARDRQLSKIVWYGTGDEGLISGELVENESFLKIGWAVNHADLDPETYVVQTQLTGSYNLENLLSAACIGTFFKLLPGEVSAGLEGYQPANNRSQIAKTENNTLICDYYNANPSSMQVALDNFDEIKKGKKVMILGDMFELGEDSPAEHETILNKAKGIAADQYIFIGDDFCRAAKQESPEFHFFKTTNEAYEFLEANPVKDSTVLIKGSRGMKLEKLVELL